MIKVKILIPSYNDWQSVSKLIDEINDLSINPEFQISIIIINDASSHDRKDEDKILENIHSITILNMKINQGHARCIATGLKYIYEGIASYTNHTITADIGFLYTTDYKDLTFAVVVKNFGGNSQMIGSDLETTFNRTDVVLNKYTTPSIFKMGFSFVPYESKSKKVVASA